MTLQSVPKFLNILQIVTLLPILAGVTISSSHYLPEPRTQRPLPITNPSADEYWLTRMLRPVKSRDGDQPESNILTLLAVTSPSVPGDMDANALHPCQVQKEKEKRKKRKKKKMKKKKNKSAGQYSICLLSNFRDDEVSLQVIDDLPHLEPTTPSTHKDKMLLPEASIPAQISLLHPFFKNRASI